jgi:hypothetical protein
MFDNASPVFRHDLNVRIAAAYNPTLKFLPEEKKRILRISRWHGIFRVLAVKFEGDFVNIYHSNSDLIFWNQSRAKSRLASFCFLTCHGWCAGEAATKLTVTL